MPFSSSNDIKSETSGSENYRITCHVGNIRTIRLLSVVPTKRHCPRALAGEMGRCDSLSFFIESVGLLFELGLPVKVYSSIASVGWGVKAVLLGDFSFNKYT